MNKFIKLMAVLRRKAHLPAVALLALMSGLTAKADVVINETTFPDVKFREYLLKTWYGEDGVLTDTEIANVKVINCFQEPIASLKGIEYFTALTDLACQANKLTSLDVSKNTALEVLDCIGNQLTSLDVSSNTALKRFYCNKNQLTTLDVSNNPALLNLYFSNNQLTSIDISNNTELVVFVCSDNQLTSLDVSKNTALVELDCQTNQLTSLDVSNNTALERFFCDNNQLRTLDVSNNTALERLTCENNQLTTLDVSKNTALQRFQCHGNQLTELDLSYNPALTTASYTKQTRALVAESALTPEGERYYYLRLDNNVNGDKSIVERMTETNFGGMASQFDPSKVLEWTSGGNVSDGILLLTDVTIAPATNTAFGTVKYKYDVNNSIDPDGSRGDFTLYWSAPMNGGSTPCPTAALELNEKAIRLQLTQSYQLEVATPDAGEITWTSSNPEAVEVDSTGRVTALKNGTAIITATTSKGVAWCAVWSNLLGDLNEDDKVDISDLNTEVSIVLGN